MTALFTRESWAEIRLIAFDVDGTLYRQRPLQLAMAREMLIDALRHCRLDAVRIVVAYRRIRERLAEEEVTDFDGRLIAETASSTGFPPAKVKAVVSEWLLRRPLPYLRACRFTGVDLVFRRLRSCGKVVGVLSDYPAAQKLAAMDLAADHIVCASDVGIMKPHPKGLEALMQAAGVDARQTLFVGDRAERDGLAGRRAGVRTLIKSTKPIEGFQTFASFDDPLFASLARA